MNNSYCYLSQNTIIESNHNKLIRKYRDKKEQKDNKDELK